MKKITVLVISIFMLFSTGMVCFAADSSETHTTVPGTQNIDVNAVFVDSPSSPDVYSVDVVWGVMEFTYTKSSSKEWNATDHTFEDKITAAWTAAGNQVTVTNHSNKKVTVGFAFNKDSAVTENITGSFDRSTATLNAGVVNGYSSADRVVSTLTLDGTLDASKTTLTKVGTIIITLSK